MLYQTDIQADQTAGAYEEACRYSQASPAEIYRHEVNGEEAARSGHVYVDDLQHLVISADLGVIVQEAERHQAEIDEYFLTTLGLAELPMALQNAELEIEILQGDYDALLSLKDIPRTSEEGYRYVDRISQTNQALRLARQQQMSLQSKHDSLKTSLKAKKALVAKSRNLRLEAYRSGAARVIGKSISECQLVSILEFYGASQESED